MFVITENIMKRPVLRKLSIRPSLDISMEEKSRH